ncbi:MAG: DUF2304 domain-containing protein [Lentisphaerae bacterium]|nr:DUF2304 domain-containing protein [Lentisphaerota bacterium]MCP4101038.1 DUF2304 domain-containing protein [Lentisphaerota bacterium]
MSAIQIISITGSLFFILAIIQAIRLKRLKEAYALLWLITGFIFLVISCWQGAIDIIADLFGIVYAPAILFLFMLVSAIIVLFQYSIILSKQNDQIKNLTQELALLKNKAQGCSKDLPNKES